MSNRRAARGEENVIDVTLLILGAKELYSEVHSWAAARRAYRARRRCTPPEHAAPASASAALAGAACSEGRW